MAGQHNKIINAAAKRILAPEGLFRVGSSRTWIDDNVSSRKIKFPSPAQRQRIIIAVS